MVHVQNVKELEANSFQSEFRTILYTLMVDNNPLMGVEDTDDELSDSM